MRACPRGHLTCWPAACPVCRAWSHPRDQARIERAIRRQAKKTARKAMEKVKHASK